MDKINGRIAQVYGYAVCLICVIVILISTHSVIDAAFDYANPMSAIAMYGRIGSISASVQESAARFHALRSLVSGIVFLVLATTMFALHWRWIRRTNAEPVVN